VVSSEEQARQLFIGRYFDVVKDLLWTPFMYA
jgi:hypothetical protein